MGGGKNKNKTKEISIFSKPQCSQGETSEPFPFEQPAQRTRSRICSSKLLVQRRGG